MLEFPEDMRKLTSNMTWSINFVLFISFTYYLINFNSLKTTVYLYNYD